MEPPALPRTGLATVRAAPGSTAELALPLPSGTPPFTYEWSRAGATLDERFRTSVDAGGVRLTVSAARTGDSGVYTLQASNAAGKDTTRVQLEVSPDEMPTGDDPPAFLRRLQDLTVKVGTRTRFLVEIVSSTECKVTWYRNERRLLEAERIALVRDGNFWCADVATVSVDDAGRWTCTAENLGGRASCSAHLNVLVPKAYKRPEFVEELRAILTEQGTVSLECKVVGVPTPVLRWFKDSCEIKAGDVFALTANADDPTSLGTYTCEAVNCMGRAYSSSKVHVIGRAKEGASPSASGVTPDPPPIFTKELEDQFVRICEPLTLSCHIVVPPWPRNVVWYNKEGKIEASVKYHVLEDGVGGYLLEVSGAEWADEGEWKCVATSAGGRVGISTCSVTMDVPKNYRKPRFMENLQAVLTEEGLVSFECKVVGFPTPVLSWFKDGQELKPGDVYQLTGTNSLGSYCCIAKNCMGQASSSAELTVEDIQNQLNEEEKLQLFSKNQAPKFLQGLKSVEVKIDEPFRFTIKVAIPPEPTVLWYRDDQPVDESPRCHLGKEDRGVFYLDIKNLELMDQTEWKCVAMNDYGHSVTSCFLKLIIPRHFKKPRFLENLQAILSDEGAVNLECKVIGVPQPVLKWYKDGEELKPGDIHRIISGQDGTCCLGTYTCEAQNCMGIAASSASLLGFEDTVKAKNKKKAEEQTLQRNLSLSTIHEERTSQMYDTPIGDVTLDDKGEISFSFDGKEVSVSLYETPDLTEEEALQIVEMYADQLSENVTEHNVVELPPLRFVKETSTSGNLLMEAIIIDVSPDYFVSPEEDLRTEADVEDISIADENGHAHLSFDQEVGEDYLEKTMALLSEEKSDIPARMPRRKSDSQRSGDDFFSLSKDPSLSEDKKDDDTQILSESASFASARSAEKLKSSKPSQDDEIPTQESSVMTKTVMLREEHRINKHSEDTVETKFSQKSMTGQKALQATLSEIPQIEPQNVGKLNEDITLISSILSKIMNNIQVMERDIILKSQLMSTAAIASKSLEIINSLITPLNDIHSITDAVIETIAESSEINHNLFSKLPDNLKDFQKSLAMVEKCLDVGNDKTFIKNTCISIIQKCDEDITQFVSKIQDLAVEDLSFMGDNFVLAVQTSTSEILNEIKIARSSIATKSIFDEEPKKDEISPDVQHLNDTQKAIYDLKIPLNSLSNIVENALKSVVINSMDINDADVILINMSASIQDLQTALEHIEFLSVEESNSTLQKYNTNTIETVMGSVLKLRTSFETLSMEKEKKDGKVELKPILQLIKENLNEISSHVDEIEYKIGSFDILQGDNKLEVLQKMAHILISLENSLPTLNAVPNVQRTMTIFHKNLTKALENVIESNETSKYLTLVRICDAVSRINASIKNIDSSKLLSLASIGNNFSIIEDIVKNNNINPELNNEILSIVNQYFSDIQNIITYTEDESIKMDFEQVKDIPVETSRVESKAIPVIHQIEQTIAVINKICPEEVTSNISNIYPVLENICPILENLKCSIASLKENAQEELSHASEMSDLEIAETFGKPLRELHDNVSTLNQLLLESTEDLNIKNEITSAVIEPVHELHNTLQVLQDNIISQYESLSSLRADVDVAATAQILQNCFLIVQEQHEMEPVEEMSTLEDVSCIKTTAESITSDHLVLPVTSEIIAEQGPLKEHSEISKTLCLLNDNIHEIEGDEIVELETLSEITELSPLKHVIESIPQLQNEIQSILPTITQESISEICNKDSVMTSLLTISQTIDMLDNCLSSVDIHNIPIYQDVLQVSSEKIETIVKSITNLKVNLEKCQKGIVETVKMAPSTPIKTIYLQKLSEDYKMCIRDSAKVDILDETSKDNLIALENSVESFLEAIKLSNYEENENIKILSEILYDDILKVQDEFTFYTVQPLPISKEDNKIIKIVSEMEKILTVIEPCTLQHSKIVDVQGDVMQKGIVSTIFEETKSLSTIEDIIDSTTKILNASAKEISEADLIKIEEFFETCKSSFFVLRLLLCQRPSQKKVIRLVQEFSVLQSKMREFHNSKSNLTLTEDVDICLDKFFIQTGENLQRIKRSLIKIVSCLSNTLFAKPLQNINNCSEYFSKYTGDDNPRELNEVVQNFLKILSTAQYHMKSLESAVINEIQCNSICGKDEETESFMESLSMFIDLLENIENTSETNENTKVIVHKLIKCIQRHQDYKIAFGGGKMMIILKCLSDCSEILRHEFMELKNKRKSGITVEHKLQEALIEIIEPMQKLNTELRQLKESDVIEDQIQTLSKDQINSYVQSITKLHQAIEEHVKSETLISADDSTVKEVAAEVASIQETLQTLQNVQDIKFLDELSTTLENTRECIDKLQTNKNVSNEHKLPKEKTDALLQHMEQYIEITEIIEEISAIINLGNVKEAKKIVEELRESIATSELMPDAATEQGEYHVVTENQENLAQQLQKSLLEIQEQTLESTDELFRENMEVKQQVIEVISQLQEDLSNISNTQLPVESSTSKTINEHETMEKDKIEISEGSVHLQDSTKAATTDTPQLKKEEGTLIVQSNDDIKIIETIVSPAIGESKLEVQDGAQKDIKSESSITNLQSPTIENVQIQQSSELITDKEVSANISTDSNVVTEEYKDLEISVESQCNANIAIHQIEEAITAINNIHLEETTLHSNEIYPVFENICPILEELKCNIASLQLSTQNTESHTSDISDTVVEEFFGKPLRSLHENISVLNQLILESVKNSEENINEPTGVFAKPLHELHNTLQILQENVISQYESLSSLHKDVDIATAAQILQSCCLLVQEQQGIETADDISTLEDLSAIKTTADSIASDILPVAVETVVTTKECEGIVKEEQVNSELSDVISDTQVSMEITTDGLEKGEEENNRQENKDQSVITCIEESETGKVTGVDKDVHDTEIVELKNNDQSITMENLNADNNDEDALKTISDKKHEEIVVEEVKLTENQHQSIASDENIKTEELMDSTEQKTEVMHDEQQRLSLETQTVVESNLDQSVTVIEQNQENNAIEETSIKKPDAQTSSPPDLEIIESIEQISTDKSDMEITDENLTERHAEEQFDDSLYERVLEEIKPDLTTSDVFEISTINYEDVIENMEALLVDLKQNIELSTIQIIDNADVIQNLLDEFQIEIIKLKSENNTEINDALTETLNDLECSVRSVQLQVSENSPPEHIMESSTTLQLLVSTVKDVLHATEKNEQLDTNKENILKECVGETENTILLLDKVSETKEDEDEIRNIIKSLNYVKDTIKSLKESFSSDEENLINKGVDILQSLDMIENQLFSIENEIDHVKNVEITTRDTIVTAVHSVYTSISNMRGTISGIQKRYIYQNYGKPSELLLNAIKNINRLNKLDSKSNWIQLSKYLRKTLNHFEDIKFYINLDKTARLPSDASLTKVVLNELKLLLTNIALANITELNVPLTNEVEQVIKKVDENIENISKQSSLEVKDKIPIFKEISLQLFEITNLLKEFYETNLISDIIPQHGEEKAVSFQTTHLPKDCKILDTESEISAQESIQKLQIVNEQEINKEKQLLRENVQPLIQSLIDEAIEKVTCMVGTEDFVKDNIESGQSIFDLENEQNENKLLSISKDELECDEIKISSNKEMQEVVKETENIEEDSNIGKQPPDLISDTKESELIIPTINTEEDIKKDIVDETNQSTESLKESAKEDSTSVTEKSEKIVGDETNQSIESLKESVKEDSTSVTEKSEKNLVDEINASIELLKANTKKDSTSVTEQSKEIEVNSVSMEKEKAQENEKETDINVLDVQLLDKESLKDENDQTETSNIVGKTQDDKKDEVTAKIDISQEEQKNISSISLENQATYSIENVEETSLKTIQDIPEEKTELKNQIVRKTDVNDMPKDQIQLIEEEKGIDQNNLEKNIDEEQPQPITSDHNTEKIESGENDSVISRETEVSLIETAKEPETKEYLENKQDIDDSSVPLIDDKNQQEIKESEIEKSFDLPSRDLKDKTKEVQTSTLQSEERVIQDEHVDQALESKETDDKFRISEDSVIKEDTQKETSRKDQNTSEEIEGIEKYEAVKKVNEQSCEIQQQIIDEKDKLNIKESQEKEEEVSSVNLETKIIESESIITTEDGVKSTYLEPSDSDKNQTQSDSSIHIPTDDEILSTEREEQADKNFERKSSQEKEIIIKETIIDETVVSNESDLKEEGKYRDNTTEDKSSEKIIETGANIESTENERRQDEVDVSSYKLINSENESINGSKTETQNSHLLPESPKGESINEEMDTTSIKSIKTEDEMENKINKKTKRSKKDKNGKEEIQQTDGQSEKVVEKKLKESCDKIDETSKTQRMESVDKTTETVLRDDESKEKSQSEDKSESTGIINTEEVKKETIQKLETDEIIPHEKTIPEKPMPSDESPELEEREKRIVEQTSFYQEVSLLDEGHKELIDTFADKIHESEKNTQNTTEQMQHAEESRELIEVKNDKKQEKKMQNDNNEPINQEKDSNQNQGTQEKSVIQDKQNVLELNKQILEKVDKESENQLLNEISENKEVLIKGKTGDSQADGAFKQNGESLKEKENDQGKKIKEESHKIETSGIKNEPNAAVHEEIMKINDLDKKIKEDDHEMNRQVANEKDKAIESPKIETSVEKHEPTDKKVQEEDLERNKKSIHEKQVIESQDIDKTSLKNDLNKNIEEVLESDKKGANGKEKVIERQKIDISGPIDEISLGKKIEEDIELNKKVANGKDEIIESQKIEVNCPKDEPKPDLHDDTTGLDVVKVTEKSHVSPKGSSDENNVTDGHKIEARRSKDEPKTVKDDEIMTNDNDKPKSEKKRPSLEKKEKEKKSKSKRKSSVKELEAQNNVSVSNEQEGKGKGLEVTIENQHSTKQKYVDENKSNIELSSKEKRSKSREDKMVKRDLNDNNRDIHEVQPVNEAIQEFKSKDASNVIDADQHISQTYDKQPYIAKEKPHFIDPNIMDSNVDFARPPGYVAKPYDNDNLLAPDVNTYSSTSKVFYKAQSLVREHQLRSPSTMDINDILETKDRPEMRLKSKAFSETRSISDKRSGSSRDLKRKPVFSTHLTNRTAVEGSRVKLTCSVLSSTEPEMKWYKNGVLLEDRQKYKIKFVDGLITMELLNAMPSDSGDYSCTVENEHGSVSTSAKLKVYPSFEPSPIPPTFTRSIRDNYHSHENELVLECRIRGQPLPTITWIKDNQPIGSDPRYQASYLADGLCRLTISNPTVEDSGTYTCKAESSMWTDQITHVVEFTGKESRITPHMSSVERARHIPDTRRPHFTNVLSDYKVVKGGTIGLQVEIGGAPTRVEWLREGSNVTELYRNAQTFVDHGIYTLSLSDVTEKHSGLYTCRAWSTHGNVDMNADITVVQPSEVEGKPAVIVSRPAKDVLISVGEDINISFRVQGEPRPKVMFMKGIRDITNSQRVCKMTSDDYVKFTLKRSVVSDAGTYCVLARNAYGCDRAFITVVVRQRASSENLISDWIYPMDDQAIVAADRKYKSVPGRIPGEPSAVDGGNNWLALAWPKPDPNAAAPVLAYRVDSWLLGKDGGARWVEMGITPRNTFDAFNLKQGEEYHFRVKPRNRYGWGEPVQTSTPIGVGISGDRPEFIDILPGLLKVLVGETANLTCSFKGKPTPEIVWMKNGHEIEEASRLRSLQSGNVCSLTIRDVKIEDEGRYSCEATNVHGRASTYARMTVITDRQIWEADAKLKRERSADAEGEYPPQFTMRLRDRRVQATYPVRLTCQVIGSPAPTITWFKDGQEVTLNSRRVKYQDEHFHTLEIAPTTLDDGGVYEALARNGSGAVSCRCSLVVDKGIRAYVAPEFCCGLEPSYRLNEGEELRISAIVEAYPSVGVTWYRDGVRLRPSRRAVMTLNRDGQIELALASVTPRDAGVYTCTASNEVGQASTSGKVEIVTGERQDQRTVPTVICPDVPYSKEPMFLKKPRSTEAQEGDTVIIECEVIGDPTPDVYWLRDFLKPDYYRDANHFKQMAAGPVYRFEIPHAKLDYTGAYSVVARNIHGEAKAIISLQIFAKDLRSSDETHNIRYGRVEVIPRFEKELTDLLCYDGDAVEFECRVSGNPEPDIRWFHYNEVLPECPDFESSFEVGTARLKIKQVAAEDEGTYTCEASNNLGKATSKACLVVYPPGEPNTLSQRLQRPPALCSAASTPRSTPRTTPARSVSRTPGPDLRRLRSPTREIAPKFYTYPFNKVVEEGESVVFQCAVGGLPPPWATWDKDGIIITPTSRISVKEKDEMLRILQIDEVSIEDVGLYRITLENDFGRSEASARLEVISHKGKFYAGTRSCSSSPRRMMSFRRRTPSYSKTEPYE